MVLPYGHTPLPFTADLPEAWKSFVCTLFVGSTGKMTVSGGRPDDAAEDAIPAVNGRGMCGQIYFLPSRAIGKFRTKRLLIRT